jgi:branched-chain amino acid transport system substrate-binding protein
MMKLIIALAALLFLTACDQRAGIVASGKTVRVKVIASQNGEGLAYGNQGLKGLLGAKALKPLLPNGDEIVFEIEDDGSDEEKSKGFIHDCDVNISTLLTFSSSDIQREIAPLIQKLKLPTLAVIATDDDFTKISQYMTRLSMSNSIEAEVIAGYIRDELLLDRVGIVFSDKSIYAQSVASDFAKKFTALEGKVVLNRSIESLNDSKIDYQKLFETSNLDLIFLSTNAELSYDFLKRFSPQQNDIKLFVSDGLLSDMQKRYPDDLELLDGALTIDHFAHDMKLNANAKKLNQYFKEKKYLLSSFGGLGYEAYQFLYSALSECQGYERECINKYFRDSKVFEGIVSVMQSIDGDMQRPIYVNEIRNGLMYRKAKVY